MNMRSLIVICCLIMLHMTGVVTSCLHASPLTLPSGPYSVQGCHMCTRDKNLFCCRCPTVEYSQAYVISDLLEDQAIELARYKQIPTGPATDFKNVDPTKVKQLYSERLHRSPGYITSCIPTNYARHCDGQLALCGDKLVCGQDLMNLRADGYC